MKQVTCGGSAAAPPHPPQPKTGGHVTMASSRGKTLPYVFTTTNGDDNLWFRIRPGSVCLSGSNHQRALRALHRRATRRERAMSSEFHQ